MGSFTEFLGSSETERLVPARWRKAGWEFYADPGGLEGFALDVGAGLLVAVDAERAILGHHELPRGDRPVRLALIENAEETWDVTTRDHVTAIAIGMTTVVR